MEPGAEGVTDGAFHDAEDIAGAIMALAPIGLDASA